MKLRKKLKIKNSAFFALFYFYKNEEEKIKMAKMKVQDFVSKAVEVEKLPTLYKLGKFMNSKQSKYYLCDCSGLIKGILWDYPSNGKYASNGVPDINADTMISRCSKVSSNFNKLPLGALVWMKGHIGIHVGNGVCVESSPIWEDGIQCTFIKGSGYSNSRGLHERQWTKQGLFDKYVDYSASTPTPSKKSVEEVAKEVLAGKWGNGDARKKALEKEGYNYVQVQNKVNELAKVSKPSQPSSNYYKKYTGKSGVLNTVLKAVGVPSKYCGDWKDRKPVAKVNGIANYTGTAEQNVKLINLAKQGKLKKV